MSFLSQAASLLWRRTREHRSRSLYFSIRVRPPPPPTVLTLARLGSGSSTFIFLKCGSTQLNSAKFLWRKVTGIFWLDIFDQEAVWTINHQTQRSGTPRIIHVNEIIIITVITNLTISTVIMISQCCDTYLGPAMPSILGW